MCIRDSVCTFLTILFAGNPLFEKLDRVKVKYGMMEPGR